MASPPHTTQPRAHRDTHAQIHTEPPAHLQLPEPEDPAVQGRSSQPDGPHTGLPGGASQDVALGLLGSLYLVRRPRHRTRRGFFSIRDHECRDITWPQASVAEPQADQMKARDSRGQTECRPSPLPPTGACPPQLGRWFSGSRLPHLCGSTPGKQDHPCLTCQAHTQNQGLSCPLQPPQYLLGPVMGTACPMSPSQRGLPGPPALVATPVLPSP